MNKTSKIILWIIIAVIIIGGIWYGVSRKPVTTEKETIKIGVILPLSGDSAFMGKSCQKAVLLAKSRTFKDTKYIYELIFEDDKKDPITGVNALNKLINVDKVDAVISFSSTQGNAISPITQQNKIIHFCVASDANIAKGEFNFIHWTPPEAEAEKFVEEMKRRNVKNMAIIMVQDPGLIETWKVSKKKLQEAGIEIVGEELFTSGTRDFKTIISKVKNLNPEIIDIGAWSPELELLGKQLKELGVDIPLTTVEAFEYTEQPELFEGYWYIQGAEATEEFNSDYFKEYHEAPQVGSANTYDIFNLIVFGFENTGKTSKEKPTKENVIKKLLRVKDFPGVLGKLTMRENGIIWSDAIVKMIENGKPVVIEE